MTSALVPKTRKFETNEGTGDGMGRVDGSPVEGCTGNEGTSCTAQNRHMMTFASIQERVHQILYY